VQGFNGERCHATQKNGEQGGAPELPYGRKVGVREEPEGYKACDVDQNTFQVAPVRTVLVPGSLQELLVEDRVAIWNIQVDSRPRQIVDRQAFMFVKRPKRGVLLARCDIRLMCEMFNMFRESQFPAVQSHEQRAEARNDPSLKDFRT